MFVWIFKISIFEKVTISNVLFRTVSSACHSGIHNRLTVKVLWWWTHCDCQHYYI